MARPAITLGVHVCVAAITGLTAVGVLGMRTSGTESSRTLSSDLLAAELHAAGLDPDSLASAGFSAVQTTTVVTQVREEFARLGAEIRAARLALQEASGECARLAAVVRSGTSTSEERAALAAAYEAEQLAKEDLTSAISALSAIATEGLPSNLVQVLERIESNAIHDLPPWHLATTRSESEWRDIRSALAGERIYEALGVSIPPETQATLNAALSVPVVAAARANHEANGIAVAVAWHDALWR